MAQTKTARKLHAKSDYRRWESTIKAAEGRPGFYIQLQCHKERRHVALAGGHYLDRDGVKQVVTGTSKRDSAKAAAHLFSLVKAKGWQDGLLEFRGELPEPRSQLTVGSYLTEVAALGAHKPNTLSTYSAKIRTIAGVVGNVTLPEDLDKFDHVNGGNAEWRRRIDSVPLESLDPEKIAEWRTLRVSEHSSNPQKQASARRSVDSCIRAGIALFAPKIIARLGHLDLPSPLPFAEIETSSEKPQRYVSRIPNPEVLLIAAKRELAEATAESEWAAMAEENSARVRPDEHQAKIAESRAATKREAFKVLVLGLCTGLRRGEIDLLQWAQVDLAQKVVRVETTDCFTPKADSHGEIPIDAELVPILQCWMEESQSRFVVDGVDPKVGTGKYHYRADRAHRTLLHWLKVTKGIQSRNAIHDLRKEFGSIICAKAGVYVASRLLRHADIRMTASVYTDDRNTTTSGLGASLAE